MTSLRSFLSLAVILVLLSACNKGGLLGIKGTGHTVQENRPVSGFSSMDLRCKASIDYVQDSLYSLQISAQPNILSILRTNVENGRLIIDFEKNVRKHNPVTITIHAPAQQAFVLSGSGSINSRSSFTGKDLELRVSGSGSMWFPSLCVKHLDAKVSGAGNISLSGGTAVSEDFSISGSGNIRAIDLAANSNASSISGSGNISTHPMQALNLSISGSGSLSYKGSPVINSRISGSGKIIHL